ncbi:hypothetical protein KH5_13930 [Urechidicola sp. KH5]
MKNIFFLSCFFATFSLLGQENISKTEESEQRTYLIAPYLLFPNMEGANKIRMLPPVEVDARPSDIFGQLKFGGMLYFETSKNKWIISTDFIYMHLAMGLEEGLVVDNGEIDLKELLFEVSFLRSLTDWIDIGVGGRVVSIKEGMTINTKIPNSIPLTGSITETWFDPVILLRSKGYFNEHWFYQARGDFGGFGLGSDFTWQIQLELGYQFTDKFGLSLGYRNLDIDYNNGQGSDYFSYDMNTFGPQLKGVFSF